MKETFKPHMEPVFNAYSIFFIDGKHSVAVGISIRFLNYCTVATANK